MGVITKAIPIKRGVWLGEHKDTSGFWSGQIGSKYFLRFRQSGKIPFLDIPIDKEQYKVIQDNVMS